MKKFLFSVILLLVCITTYSQEFVDNKKLFIDLYKSRVLSNTGHLTSGTKIKSNGVNKVVIKCNVKYLGGEFDYNLFYLLDNTNKIRYRPMEVYQQSIQQGYFRQPYSVDINRDDLKKYSKLSLESFLEEKIKDKFHSYSIDGYTDVEVPMNFGNRKKTLVGKYCFATIYPKKRFQAFLFFAIKNLDRDTDLVLYYGNDRLESVYPSGIPKKRKKK